MTAVGGPIESLSLDGRLFPVDGEAEVQRKLGGFENEVMSNGDQTARLIKTSIPLSLDGVPVEIDDSRGDQEFIQALQDRFDFFPIAITYASGITYQGAAQIVGEVPASSKNATAPISLKGPGLLTKQ